MLEGLKQVERHRDREYMNRVILLSDGLANRGITDVHELRKIAQRYRARSISLTTMGVGLDYNENLMMGLSKSGGGNYYFIESPNSLSSIFRRELRSLACVAVQNASIEMSLADGVRVRDVIGCDQERDGGKVVISIGDLYAGEARELTIELEVPEGTGTLRAVKGVVKYDGKRGWFESWPSFEASIHYTNDLSEVEKNRDNAIQSKVDVAVSTRNVDQALQALDQGRKDEAADYIRAAEVNLRSSPVMGSGAGAAALVEQASRLGSFQKLLKDTVDLRKAKKAIQYQNYQTQKQEK